MSTKPEVVRCKKISSNGNGSVKPKHISGNWLTQLEKTEVILRLTDSNCICDLIALNMAGERSSQQSINIQDIVRAVVDNFNTLPSRSINNSTSSATSLTASRPSTTIGDELNRCFQIPRSKSHPNSQPLSQPNLTGINSLSSGFSARANYGATSARRRPRSNHCSSTGWFQPYSRSTSQISAEPKVFYKEVCLLPLPMWDTVPRGNIKVDLIERNLCVDAWAVDKSWTKEDLTCKAAKLFPKVLGSDNPEPVP